MFKLINIVAFELCWIAVVWGAGSGLVWPGVSLMLVFFVANAWASPCRRADLSLAAVAMGLGVIVDTLFIHTGLVEYASPGPLTVLAPIWILALWLGFSQTINHALSWLQNRVWLAAVFGAIGGPLSYWAAERVFQAAQFPSGMLPAMLALAVAWGLITPMLTVVAGRLCASNETKSD